MELLTGWHTLHPSKKKKQIINLNIKLKAIVCYLNLFKPCEIFLTKLNNVVILDDVKVMKQLLKFYFYFFFFL